MKTIKITGIFAAVFLLLAVMCRFTVTKLQLDGYTGLLFRILLYTDDTVYARDYTDKNFLALKRGMTKQQVIWLLGRPFAEFNRTGNAISMQYSKSQNDTHYRARTIRLQNDKVIDIISYYYVD
ncbi:hypothetical protein SAMN05421741_1398 [Paenimyroides ummariense]|uniref:SmpA / OmlA family protein n=1 Tax=Paenimyroides ummariense TaxID=913024 RepID=A0A1I5GD60_9FLAO|nr:hypothetical protein [Paenimyroides ummariense]SFO33793.1 hypothetical protein SAMN05421741_1398 [Paenimyroides ummariense]